MHLGHRDGICHKKCVILIMRSGRQSTMEGIELQNQGKIRTLGKKENYKYIENGHHQPSGDERKN